MHLSQDGCIVVVMSGQEHSPLKIAITLAFQIRLDSYYWLPDFFRRLVYRTSLN